MAALTTVFSGTIPANPTRTSWVAVPASSVYTINIDSASGASNIGLEFSLDGTIPLDIGSNNLRAIGSTYLSYQLMNVPIQYMRAYYNTSGTPSGTTNVKVLSL